MVLKTSNFISQNFYPFSFFRKPIPPFRLQKCSDFMKINCGEKSFSKGIIFYTKIDAKIYEIFIQIAKMESLRRRFRNSTPSFYGIFIQIQKVESLNDVILNLEGSW